MALICYAQVLFTSPGKPPNVGNILMIEMLIAHPPPPPFSPAGSYTTTN